MTIEDNIARSKTREQAVRLVLEFAREVFLAIEDVVSRPDLFMALSDAAKQEIGLEMTVEDTHPCPIPDAMTDEESIRFEQRPMPFGQLQGIAIKNVSLKQLCWYADQRFLDELRRYLRAPRIQRELNREFEEEL